MEHCVVLFVMKTDFRSVQSVVELDVHVHEFSVL